MNELDIILMWLAAIVVAFLLFLASIVGADLTGWLP
jgi:hypothetical protein